MANLAIITQHAISSQFSQQNPCSTDLSQIFFKMKFIFTTLLLAPLSLALEGQVLPTKEVSDQSTPADDTELDVSKSAKFGTQAVCPGSWCNGMCCPYNWCCPKACCDLSATFCGVDGHCYRWV